MRKSAIRLTQSFITYYKGENNSELKLRVVYINSVTQ